MPIILFLNIKGGVAKTTTAVGVSEALAAMGKRVLVIDADHQCASSSLLLGEGRFIVTDQRQETLHDLLTRMLDEEFRPSQFAPFVAKGASNIKHLKGTLDVIPCSFRINDFHRNRAKGGDGRTTQEYLSLLGKRRRAFSKWLKSEYDFTIIDCPPSLAFQVTFMLRLSDGFVIPSVPDHVSVRGARWLLEHLAKAAFTRPALGMVWTLYREQNASHKKMVSAVGRASGNKESDSVFRNLPRPFTTIVPNAAAIVRAHETPGQTASLSTKYTAEFAHVFEALAREIAAVAV